MTTQTLSNPQLIALRLMAVASAITYERSKVLPSGFAYGEASPQSFFIKDHPTERKVEIYSYYGQVTINSKTWASLLEKGLIVRLGFADGYIARLAYELTPAGWQAIRDSEMTLEALLATGYSSSGGHFPTEQSAEMSDYLRRMVDGSAHVISHKPSGLVLGFDSFPDYPDGKHATEFSAFGRKLIIETEIAHDPNCTPYDYPDAYDAEFIESWGKTWDFMGVVVTARLEVNTVSRLSSIKGHSSVWAVHYNFGSPADNDYINEIFRDCVWDAVDHLWQIIALVQTLDVPKVSK